MEFVIFAIVMPAVVVIAGLVVEQTRGARCERRRRRAAAGEAVRLPARLGLRGHRWMPRGVLLRDGEDLLWLSRRPFGRPVRFSAAVLAEEGRFVDATGSDFIDRTYRDYALRAETPGTLRVPDWLTPALDALRTTPAPGRHSRAFATVAPRWLLALPALVILAFSPLALAWSNGEDVRAEITGHDREYSMCDIAWQTPRGAGTATIDCHLEPIGSALPARALGDPFAGNAADTHWTPHVLLFLLIAGTALPVGVLLAHLLPARLRRPIELIADPEGIANLSAPEPAQPPTQTVASDDRTRWQDRAAELAARHTLPAAGDSTMPAWVARWRVKWAMVGSAAGVWLGTAAVLILVGGLLAALAGSALWTLSHAETTVVTGEVTETSRFFLTHETFVDTGDDEELVVSTWSALNEGQQVSLTRAGDVAAVPGDIGPWVDLGQSSVALLAGAVCLLVARRRIRAARPDALSHDAAGDTHTVPYAAFRMPDDTTLVVTLDHTGASALVVPVRGPVPPAGVVNVPRTLRAGHVVAPVIDDQPRVPHAPVEDIDDTQLQELLDDIA